MLGNYEHADAADTNVFTLMYHDECNCALTVTVEERADRVNSLWTILHEATGRAEPTSMGLRRTAPQQVDAMQTEESARQENMPASGVVGEDTDLDVVKVLTEIDVPVPMEDTSKRKGADIPGAPSPTTVVS